MTLSTIRAFTETYECVLEAKIEILKIENFSKGTTLNLDFGHFEAFRKPKIRYFYELLPCQIDFLAQFTSRNVFSE